VPELRQTRKRMTTDDADDTDEAEADANSLIREIRGQDSRRGLRACRFGISGGGLPVKPVADARRRSWLRGGDSPASKSLLRCAML